MIKGKLHKTQPAYVTESETGCDYLDLIMELEDGKQVRITMPIDAMGLLGCMMAKVASGIKNRNIRRN